MIGCLTCKWRLAAATASAQQYEGIRLLTPPMR